MKNPLLFKLNVTLRDLLVILLVGILLIFGLVKCSTRDQTAKPTATLDALSSSLSQTALVSSTAPATLTATPTQTSTATLIPTMTNTPPALGSLGEGFLVLSMEDGGYTHLFAYGPQSFPLARLTNGAWDDITPAISPDGKQVAYSSRQNGYWNLYTLNLDTGSTTQLTDDPAFQANPSWSPDGKWLAYEQYQGSGNWDIEILSVENPSQAPTQLTQDAAMEESPSWSPQGRMIAFVSNSSGNNDIWIANLDSADQPLQDISNTSDASEAHPAWSPDGNELAWASTSNGASTIYVWDEQKPENAPRKIGNGNWPVWSPDGKLIFTTVDQPNQTQLIVYQADTGAIILPAQTQSGTVQGVSWGTGSFPTSLPENLARIKGTTPTPLWQATLSATSNASGRQGLATLGDATAPYPYLADTVDESFQALRTRLANEIGWDYLADLENAFVPLNNPLPPSDLQDWLYTGRSFMSNSVPIKANWMFVVREDFNDQTYWRVYLKARYQDGSQGIPVDQIAWDLNSRYNGNAQVYENGGELASSLPSGYWLDFTDLALRYGWVRLPSLDNWRNYYNGIRFNQFVLMSNLDWQSAMLQIYPSSILITPTAISPSTATSTSQPYWMATVTPTPDGYHQPTATLHPTWTPATP